MNKQITILIVLLSLILSIHQTNAQYFAPVGAKWTYTRLRPSVPPSVFTGYGQLESIKDTNILGNTCKLIIETYEDNSVQDSLYMYKDSSEKVFYFNSDSNRFCLLYDFNALPGDSFSLDCYTATGSPLIVHVDSISQININGKNRKVQYYRASSLPYDFTGQVIEDIGHIIHLFPTPEDYLKGPLRCYQDDSLGLYNTGVTTNCNDVITGIDDIKSDLDEIKVFPTFVEDNVYITNKKNKKVNIIINSILGNKEFILNDFTKNKIDLSNLSSGIYFITIFNDEDYFTTKIIKK